MRKYGFILCLLLIPLFLSGMGERPGSIAPAKLSTDKDVYAAGEKVTLTISFTNTGTGDISSYFPSAQKFDFIVMGPDKKEIWRWSAGKMFTMAIQPFALEVGKSVSFSASWDQKDLQLKQVAPGRYFIRGYIKLAQGLSSSGKEITINEADKVQ